jgi:hypothetical protein
MPQLGVRRSTVSAIFEADKPEATGIGDATRRENPPLLSDQVRLPEMIRRELERAFKAEPGWTPQGVMLNLTPAQTVELQEWCSRRADQLVAVGERSGAERLAYRRRAQQLREAIEQLGRQ